MAIVKLVERDYSFGKYEFTNAADHPLEKTDFNKLMQNGMHYNNPRDYYDDEYGDESWLLWGKQAQVRGYFLNEKAVTLLKELGYTVEIDTLKQQQDRTQHHNLKVSKREQLLRLVINFIKATGEKPGSYQDPVRPIGEQIETPITRKSNVRLYGGGEWFVIGTDYIWYVQNNGADGDFWAANNVVTGGAGAIGWRVPHSDYLAEKVRLASKDLAEITETDDFSFLTPTPNKTS